MFETSVVNARAIAAPRKAGVLSMSLAFHTVVVAAAVAMSVQTSSFPADVPRQMEMLREVMPMVELPKGNPDAPRDQTPKPPPQQPAQHAQTAPPLPQADTAPNQIPNTTTPVASTDTSGPGNGDSHETTEQWGARDGNKDAVDVGQLVVPGPAAAAPTGPLVAVGEVHAARVLSRVEPKYPGIAVHNRIAGVVKVQCVIDKNGKLSDPEIVSSTFPMFNQPVIDALRQWTFAPGTLHGSPVDTYFELTITFTTR